jgi:hypothetical protein
VIISSDCDFTRSFLSIKNAGHQCHVVHDERKPEVVKALALHADSCTSFTEILGLWGGGKVAAAAEEEEAEIAGEVDAVEDVDASEVFTGFARFWSPKGFGFLTADTPRKVRKVRATLTRNP